MSKSNYTKNTAQNNELQQIILIVCLQRDYDWIVQTSSGEVFHNLVAEGNSKKRSTSFETFEPSGVGKGCQCGWMDQLFCQLVSQEKVSSM